MQSYGDQQGPTRNKLKYWFIIKITTFYIFPNQVETTTFNQYLSFMEKCFISSKLIRTEFKKAKKKRFQKTYCHNSSKLSSGYE